MPQFRPGYHPRLFEILLNYHTSSGPGRFDLVLDVGCGIGGPMRSIARFSGATIVGDGSRQVESIPRATRRPSHST